MDSRIKNSLVRTVIHLSHGKLTFKTYLSVNNN